MRPLRPELRDGVPLAEANATLTRILGAIEEYIYTGEFLPDGAYRLIFAGPCREQFLGLSRHDAQTAIWSDYVHPEDMAVFEAAHHEGLVTGWLDVEYRMVGADGVMRWVRDRGRMREEGGQRFLDGSILDVTAMQSAQEALEAARAEAHRLATVDPLTGVANRRVLPVRLTALCARGAGVLLVDADHFKQVNDLYGHPAGDTVLVELTRRLTGSIRDGDEIVRMGGDEFLILLPGLTDVSSLLKRGEAVRAAADRPVPVEGGLVALTVSVGAALAASTTDPEELLAAADRGLYAAKRRGRNRTALGAADATADSEPELEMSDTLRLATAFAAATAGAEGVDQHHLDEVSVLAARVARRLGGLRPLAVRCRLAGLLHDVGKLRTPGALLTRPGALTGAEWEVMRTHPATGAELIGAVPELRDLAPIVRHHHERWDGAGYPDGLAGAAIPFEARIIAAVDTWSAMTGDRPYRAARDRASAMAELERVAGAQLDPDVVVALLEELTSSRADVRPAPAPAPAPHRVRARAQGRIPAGMRP